MSSDITGKINEKRLAKTGVTEEILTRLADAEGGEITIIAQVRYEQVTKKRDKSRAVSLVMTDIEVATVGDADEHVRGVQRALHMNRKLHGTDAQPALIDSIDDVEPSVEDVMAKGVAFTPHDFIREIDGPNCNICGKPDTAPLHNQFGELDDDYEDDEDLDDDEDDEHLPHQFIDGPDALCTACGKPAGQAIHNYQTEEVPA